MTQQDKTGQSAATDQFMPLRPSPYLATGDSAPQAYPAPPQPGQPRYATPPEFPTRRPAGDQGANPYARPGYGQQPRYGQTGYGQAGYGQAAKRPGRRLVPRDPAIAAPWQRLVASILDWIIIWLVAIVPFWSSLQRLVRDYRAIGASYRDLNSPAAQAALNHVMADPGFKHIALWPVALVGVALAYYWAQHAAWGATIGKHAVGIRVVTSAGQGRISIRTAGVRAVAFLLGPAMLWLWPLTGPINIVGGALWTADAGFALLDPRAQCLHDKLAGTLVMKKRWLDQQARSADR